MLIGVEHELVDAEDLDAWAEQGLRRSTSDPGKGVVHPAKRIDGYTGPVRR